MACSRASRAPILRSPAVRAKLLDGLRRIANASALMANALVPDVEVHEVGAAVVSDDAVLLSTEAVLKSAFGNADVHRMPAMTASEDFSQHVKEGIPSMFFFTGVYDPNMVRDAEAPGGQPIAFNHSPFCAPVPEPSIKTATQAMSLVVLNMLGH